MFFRVITGGGGGCRLEVQSRRAPEFGHLQYKKRGEERRC